MAKKRYKFGGEWIEVEDTPGKGKTKKFTARSTGEKYSEPNSPSIGMAPSITEHYQSRKKEGKQKNDSSLTNQEEYNNRIYNAYENEIKKQLSESVSKNPLVLADLWRQEKQQNNQDFQQMIETAESISYLRSEQNRIPYTMVSDAGKIVKTGDKVKVIKPGEDNLYQGDAPALGGPLESGSETVRKRYSKSIQPFFENEDYLSDGNQLFEKYGESAIPLIENALAEWKENERLHPERVQAGSELTEQANNFEKQLRRTLAALKEIQYTEKRKNEDFSELSEQGAKMDSPATTAAERLSSDNKFVAGVGLMLGDHRYAMMTEEERQLYNYLLAKEGEQSAQGYLNTIEDRLNSRFGKAFHDEAESLENPVQRAGITALTSVGAGLHDFGTGIHQNFTDDPVPRAPLQYAADIYSSELDGISKFAFDSGRTIGNMTPSIAASVALGGFGAPAAAAGAVSSAMSGLSSAGNSYREAIKQGYLPGEARQYASMSGISEFGTSYLLSGISKFGGKLTRNAAKAASERVTNGALRFALDTGIKMGGEGIEEVLQNELDLFFRNMVLGEDNDLNPLTEENAYTFLMAMSTAGILEGPSSARNTWNSYQLEQAGRSVETSGNLNALLNRSMEGSPELRKAAEKVIYSEPGDVKARNEAVGGLFLQYTEETGDAGLILRTPERNEQLARPETNPVFMDESRQKYGTKTGENFVALPVFKDGKPVETDKPSLPKGVQIVENKTVESGSGMVHDVPKGAVGSLPNGVKSYTLEQAQQKNRVRDTYMSFVISGKQGLKDFWNRITSRDNNGAKKETAYLGLVTPEMGKVYEQVIGQDLTNYSYSVDSDMISHVQKEHGVDGRRRGIGEVPVNEDGFGELLDILQHPDEIYDGGVDDVGHRVVITVRRSGGTTAYIQWVQENNKGVKRLNGKTFFISSEDVVPTWENSEHKSISWVKNEQKKKTPDRLNSAQSTPPPYVQNVTGPSSLDTNISQSETGVNTQSMQEKSGVSTDRNSEDSTGAFGDDSVGAARPLSTEEKAQRYDDYVREYGAIPKGENPVRDVDVPRKTGENSYTRRGARTFLESGNTPEVMVQELKAAVADDLFSYERLSNKDAQDAADLTLYNKGFDGALEEWNAAVIRGENKVKDIVLGETLYLEAAKRGDLDLATQIAAEVSEMATDAGRVVQAMRMLKKATPAGKLYGIESAVDKINRDLRQKYKKKFKRGKMQDVSISNELKEKLLNAETSEQADAVLSEIERYVADQLPSTVGDRVDAIRYFAMLSNPKTHIRNLFGNVVFGRAVDAKDVVGAAIERLALPEAERTKAILTPKDRALRDFAREDFETVRGDIMGTGKMNPQSRIESQKKVFEHEILNKITGLPGDLLELSDGFALRSRYTKSLASFLKARGITAENINTDKGQRTLSAGRQYAITEAQKATFRDASRVANALSRAEKKNAATRVLIGGVIPFKKTPINVLKRGVEYSPVGLIKGTTDLLTKVRDNKMSASQAIDEISAGTVGTGLAVLGYWLGSMGIVSLGGSDDEKERGFDALQGKQNYALNIGGKSYTIDWLSPAAMPFFVGAEFQKLLEEGSDLAPKDMLEAVSKILDPVLEMSFMDGVQDTLKSAAYGEFGGPLANIVVSPFVNYPSQFIPSVLGGVARTVDPVRRSYYADKNNNVFANSMQKSFQKAVAKIPYFSQTLEPYVDQWGREEVNDSVFGRLVENFVSPGYYSEENITAVDEEIERLYAQTGEKTVLPAYAPDDVTQDNKKYNMTAKEHTQYAKTKGQTAFNTINALLNTSDYKAADDTEKLKFIEDAYKYANQVAKKELLSGRGVAYKADKWVEETYSKAKGQNGGTSVAKSIAFRRTLAEADLGVESYDKVRTAQSKVGISYQDYADVYADISSVRKQYEDSDEKSDKVREAIYGNPNLNDDQKAYMSFLFVRGDIEDADALKTLGGISYSVYESYLNEASTITAKDENGNTVNGLAKQRKEKYIDSLPISYSQKELLKATISTSKASKSYLKYRIEVAPLTREQKAELWEHFFGD